MDLRAGLSINGVSVISTARAGAFSSLTNGATLATSDSSTNAATTAWVKSLGYTTSTGDATVAGNNTWSGINSFTKELTVKRGTAATTGIVPLDFDPNSSVLPMVYQAWVYDDVSTPTTDAHGSWHLSRNAQSVAEGTDGTPVGSTYPQWSQQRNNPSWDFKVATDGFTMRYLPTQGSVATFYDAAWKQQLKVGASSVDIGSSTNSLSVSMNGSTILDTSRNLSNIGTITASGAIAGGSYKVGANTVIDASRNASFANLTATYVTLGLEFRGTTAADATVFPALNSPLIRQTAKYWNGTASTDVYFDRTAEVTSAGVATWIDRYMGTTIASMSSAGLVTNYGGLDVRIADSSVAPSGNFVIRLYNSTNTSDIANFCIAPNGTHFWGAGGASGLVDTNLYRSAANILKTDDAFQAASYAVGTTSVIDSGRNLNNIAALTMAGTFLTNSGTAATSGVTLVNSPDITLRGKYWNGTASTTYDATIRHTMSLASGPGSSIDFLFGGTSKASIANNGNVAVNGLYINTTQVIDSSRNLLNVGTISSGALTSSGAVQGTQFNVGSTNIIDTSGNVTQPAWQTPSSLTTPWIAYSDAAWQSVRYMKDRDGTVHVQGLVVYNGPAPSAATTVFTLPGGYTPAKNLTFASVANNQFARLNVLSSGAVQWEGGASPTSWFSISCSFKAG